MLNKLNEIHNNVKLNEKRSKILKEKYEKDAIDEEELLLKLEILEENMLDILYDIKELEQLYDSCLEKLDSCLSKLNK